MDIDAEAAVVEALHEGDRPHAGQRIDRVGLDQRAVGLDPFDGFGPAPRDRIGEEELDPTVVAVNGVDRADNDSIGPVDQRCQVGGRIEVVSRNPCRNASIASTHALATSDDPSAGSEMAMPWPWLKPSPASSN